MAGIIIASCALLVASLLVLADAVYQLVHVPTDDERRRRYYHRD